MSEKNFSLKPIVLSVSRLPQRRWTTHRGDILDRDFVCQVRAMSQFCCAWCQVLNGHPLKPGRPVITAALTATRHESKVVDGRSNLFTISFFGGVGPGLGGGVAGH
jgi:hypothetical protein